MKKEKFLLILILLLYFYFPTSSTLSQEDPLSLPSKQQEIKALLQFLSAEEAKSTDTSPSTPSSLDEQPLPEEHSAVPP